MKLKAFLKHAALAAVWLFAGAASAQFSVDLSSATASGTAANTMLIQNIRVLTPVYDPTTGNLTAAQSGYNATFTFDPATLALVPTDIVLTSGNGAAACASVNVQVSNATNGAAISGATVTIGSKTSTSNGSGVATFSGFAASGVTVNVVASGYTTTSQNASLDCSAINYVAVALSPASGQTGGLSAGQFRAILTWGANPSDLDSHMTGPIAGSASRWHVYYSDRNSGGICALDHDNTASFGPETITCPATGTSTALPNGVYRYSVYDYTGSGTIGSSGANVRLEFGNGAVYNYTPPSGGWSGQGDAWTVFEVTINNDSVSVAPVNAVTSGVSPGSVSAPKRGALRFGQPESPSIFTNRSK